jgi:hypothetical protein
MRWLRKTAREGTAFSLPIQDHPRFWFILVGQLRTEANG